MSTSINQFNFTADVNNNSDGAGDKDSDNAGAPVKRKRLTQACDACRKKKVKCSGEKPSCNNCTRLNVPCTYLPSTRKRGPRVGLVESLEKRLQQMEKLLQPLKEQGLVDDSDDQSLSPTKKTRLNSIDSNTSNDPDDQLYSDPNSSATSTMPRLHQQSQEFTTSTIKTHASTPPSQFNNQTLAGHNEQTEFIDSFSQPLRSQQSQFRNKNVSPMIESIRGDRNLSDSQPIKIEEDNDFMFFGNTAVNPGYKKKGPCSAPINSVISFQSHIPSSVLFVSNGLPTEDIVEHLALCFFRHVGGNMAMFHQHTFMRRLRQNKVSPFLILAMCSVSARFSDHPNIRRDPAYLAGEPYSTQANKYLLEALDTACLENIQAFLLLALYGYGSALGSKTYTYIGIAIRMAHSLGLHKIDDITSNSSSDCKGSEDVFIAKETKRRTFWSCFVLDRFSSCALGRPSIIQEEDCDVRFPCIESIWDLENPYNSPAIDELLNSDYTKQGFSFTLATSGISACFFSAVALLGRICTYVNRSRPATALPPWDPASEFSMLHKDLEIWYQSVLPNYAYSRERMLGFMAVDRAGAFAAIHLFYLTAVVVLNRAIIKARKCESKTIPNEFFHLSYERCYNAAKQVSSIASDILKISSPCVCPFTTYPTYVIATIYIYQMNSEDITIANIAKENVKISEQYLEEMGELWATAKKLRCILGNIKKDHGYLPTSESFSSENKRPLQNESEIMSDAGLMAYWNSAINTTDVNIINNTSMNAFPDQIISSRFLYNLDHPFIGDSWTNFLRSPSVSPGFLRRFSRSAESGESANEEGYFSQDMTLYSNNNQFAYDYSMIGDMSTGQPFTEWSDGRIMPNRRNLVDMGEMGSMIQNSLTPNQAITSSNINVPNVNVLVGNSTNAQLLNPIGDF
ncbi:14471_t:CDS:2 [Cetraspora pellucida]|uniref:14471_t:CDS:1 n=1 Tax=Cetraspora pellucida TaxID=1433469 RepID=A0ACA9K4U8_9GLOM|nr:14471_t:CDS:2 [Cetraspora pellucida]